MKRDKEFRNVPSNKELKKLMENARRTSSKAIRKNETLEQNYIRITEENIYKIFSNSSIKYPFFTDGLNGFTVQFFIFPGGTISR